MSTTIHRRKLFGGRCTAEEFHRAHAFPVGARCAGCRSTKVGVRAQVLVPLAELRARDPMADLAMTADPAGFARVLVQTVHGPHVRLSTVYACDRCAPSMERALAKQPSWVIVDINRGPGPDKLVRGAG